MKLKLRSSDAVRMGDLFIFLNIFLFPPPSHFFASFISHSRKAVNRYVSCECDEVESRGTLMKAISGLNYFRGDSPTASPERYPVRELHHGPQKLPGLKLSSSLLRT